jgi:hypothetical protein
VGGVFQEEGNGMSGKPYRLSEGGSRIDRTQPLSFTFDGKTLSGFAGDTIASAVMASGQKLFGRSFKYHRPRGVVGLGSEEMNALVGVGIGARHEPNLRATQVELFGGLAAVSQNRWPSLSIDVGAASSLLSRFFPGGFYYKTFMWPKAFWKHVYEPVIRRATLTPTSTCTSTPMPSWWVAALRASRLRKQPQLRVFVYCLSMKIRFWAALPTSRLEKSATAASLILPRRLLRGLRSCRMSMC